MNTTVSMNGTVNYTPKNPDGFGVLTPWLIVNAAMNLGLQDESELVAFLEKERLRRLVKAKRARIRRSRLREFSILEKERQLNAWP